MCDESDVSRCMRVCVKNGSSSGIKFQLSNFSFGQGR